MKAEQLPAPGDQPAADGAEQRMNGHQPPASADSASDAEMEDADVFAALTALADHAEQASLLLPHPLIALMRRLTHIPMGIAWSTRGTWLTCQHACGWATERGCTWCRRQWLRSGRHHWQTAQSSWPSKYSDPLMSC